MSEPQSEGLTPSHEIMLPPGFKLDKLPASEVQTVYETLEQQAWAPWLQYTQEDIAGQVAVFPDGQLLITDAEGKPAAALSTIRYQVDDLNDLPSWDYVAGIDTVGDATFSETYTENGNALVFMSASVREEDKGRHLAPALASAAIETGKQLGVQYVLGPFRPSGYGEFKRSTWEQMSAVALLENRPVNIEEYLQAINFDSYCERKRDDGLPLDPWLRSLSRLGMQPLQTHQEAMRIEVSMEEFNEYRQSYRPDRWYSPSESYWECGETGSWRVSRNQDGEEVAIYTEPNKWGSLYRASK